MLGTIKPLIDTPSNKPWGCRGAPWHPQDRRQCHHQWWLSGAPAALLVSLFVSFVTDRRSSQFMSLLLARHGRDKSVGHAAIIEQSAWSAWGQCHIRRTHSRRRLGYSRWTSTSTRWIQIAITSRRPASLLITCLYIVALIVHAWRPLLRMQKLSADLL